MRARLVAWLLCTALAAVPVPSRAVAGTIPSFTNLTGGNIVFHVNDVTTAMNPGSITITFSLHFKTGTLPGSITLGISPFSGTTGGLIPSNAFIGSCTLTAGSSADFTQSSPANIRLSSIASPVTCATLTASTNKTIQFQVSLYIDNKADSTSFTADTYSVLNSLAVTANAP